MKKYALPFVKTVLPLLVGIYLFWYFFSSMSQEHVLSFQKALREANYFWVFLAMVLEFISLWSRAHRWKYMLEPLGFRSSWANRYHAMMIGYLANYTLPRAGEPTRAAMLFRSDGIPFVKSFGTIIAERAVDVIMLGLILGITLLFGYSDLVNLLQSIPQQFSDNSASSDNTQLGSIAVVIIVIIGGVIVLLNKKLRTKVWMLLLGIIEGVLAIFKTPHPLAFIAHTLLIWLCWILMFIVPFYSLSETSHVPLTGMMIGFIVGSLGMSLTNGGIGVYPLLVGFVVAFYMENNLHAKGVSNALGMIIWLGNTAIMILLGLISLVLLPKNYTKNTDNHDTTSIPSQ